MWNHPPPRDRHSIITSHICRMDLMRTTQLGMVRLRLLVLQESMKVSNDGPMLFLIRYLSFLGPYGDQFDVQGLSKHTHTQIRDLIHGVQVFALKCLQKKCWICPLEVLIWLLLVSSVQGPRLQFLKGKPSSEKQEPWVGLRLTRDSRLLGLVWVSESQPVFSSISYILSLPFSRKHFD